MRSNVPTMPRSQVVQHALSENATCGVVGAENQNVYGHTHKFYAKRYFAFVNSGVGAGIVKGRFFSSFGSASSSRFGDNDRRADPESVLLLVNA
jgi:hypothetical protein